MSAYHTRVARRRSDGPPTFSLITADEKVQFSYQTPPGWREESEDEPYLLQAIFRFNGHVNVINIEELPDGLYQVRCVIYDPHEGIVAKSQFLVAGSDPNEAAYHATRSFTPMIAKGGE